MPNKPESPRRIRLGRHGPMLVEGPVTVTGDDGVSVTSERFMVAVCTCRRSRAYPWCDTSHRRRAPEPLRRPGRTDTTPGADGSRSTCDDKGGDPE
ncbi:CDGSH iron-sulfur domain-containing protein [Streptomyces sp. MnatMP-M17]|uniref:CDGSH iron-sulfur domain-containing protein n=1 Tax=unclassified Streptomyces TaxID=2593676 RepID=UPI000B866B40|nr:CDGSH iron-sulfur domain-containing protein [Streptomyces sp. MnatMP-M17]MYZ36327.1 CDGSH iron-sulfur domain-containing protein [Streptomyces sp. SID4917]